ncbi:MAG: redoxin domain-containing protein, partial [Sphingopyxis terrae]
MILVRHRRNTLDELRATDPSLGIEVDIRSHGSRLIIHHDAFVDGEDFERWLDGYRHRLLILNVKEEGLEDRLIALQADYEAKGARFVAINANETANHPEDSFDKMKDFAALHGFPFPYLHDDSQAVARAYERGIGIDANTDESIRWALRAVDAGTGQRSAMEPHQDWHRFEKHKFAREMAKLLDAAAANK